MVVSSDIAMVCLLGTITDFGRNKIPIEINEVLLLLTFLSDNISLGSCCLWKNKKEFLDHLSSSYLSESSPLYANLIKKLSLPSIDSLMDLMESAQDFLLAPSGNVDPNGVSCPFMFKRESLVGVYLRTILVQWDLLQFGDLSQLFGSYCSFLSSASSSSRLDSGRREATSSKVLPIQAIKANEPRAFLTNAEMAIKNLDLLPAVESIHSYFDSNGVNPLKPKGDLLSQTKTILENYSSGTPQQKTRYQQAMLSLANMWIRNGYYFFASTATEEGMKMAHQLGDHASVTYALLLLHHIIHGPQHLEFSPTDDSATGSEVEEPAEGKTQSFEDQSTENILIRCIQKSSELKLKSLEIQAIQLLVRYRMNGPLKQSVPVSLGYRLASSASSSTSCEMTPYMLWALLQSTLTQNSSPLFTKASQIKPKNPHLPPSHQEPRSSSSSSTPPPLSYQNKMDFFCQSYLLSSDLWSRLALPSMSLLTTYRAFRHCGVNVSTSSFLQIILNYCSLLHEINEDGSVCLLYALEFSSYTSIGSGSGSSSFMLLSPSQKHRLTSLLQKLNLSFNILNNISRLNLDLDPDIRFKLQISKYFIQMKQHLLHFFLSLPSESSSREEEVTAAMNSLKLSLKYCHLLTDNLLNEPKFINSSEYLMACTYQVYLLSFFDYQLAIDRIQEFLNQNEKKKRSPFVIRWRVELRVMRIIILEKELSKADHRERRIELKIEMRECLECATEEYLPLVSGVVSMISSSLWRQQQSEIEKE
jgi:hypothetical protein